MSDTPPPMPISPGARMSCAETRPYLSAYADGELAEPLRAQVAQHLLGCAECAARVEGYRSTDALLANLPATSPSPEVFHAVMAAAREQSAEPVEHETLASPFAGLAPRRPRLVRPEPRQRDGPTMLPGARGKSWIATVAPAVAAVLLIALAALAFRGLVTREVPPATTPTPRGTILERTQAQIDEVARTTQLPFTPVPPAHVPNGVSDVQVTVGPDSANVIYLDIVWTVTSNANLQLIRIREVKSGYDFYGYSPDTDTSNGAVSWKLISGRTWQPLKRDGQGQISATIADNTSVAAGERRDTLSIAVEAVGTPATANVESLRQTLRQVTLSMDGSNKVIPLASRRTTGLVLHYKAQSQVTGGETPAWSAEVYINPATDGQRVEVSANGKLRYVDVSRGPQQGYRLDVQTGAYATGPRDQFSGDMSLDGKTNNNVLQIFRSPYTPLQTGLLWYSGTARVGSANVYDYILVSAPNETHIYIDQQTGQVVKLEVDPKAVWSYPYNSSQIFGQDKCSYFTFIEYVQPETVADKFSLTPPSNSHQDQSGVPATVNCS